MAIGFGVLKLPPNDFWHMTPVELDAALRGLFGDQIPGEHPDRMALDALIDEFPDIERN